MDRTPKGSLKEFATPKAARRPQNAERTTRAFKALFCCHRLFARPQPQNALQGRTARLNGTSDALQAPQSYFKPFNGQFTV